MSDSTATPTQRLDSIDLWRGLIICLMVLDHSRDFISREAYIFLPLDLTHTTPFLFMTRWITHLCAPTFVFLSGVSIFLQEQKGKTGADLSRFLLVRGLWLIVLELTVVNFGFDFWPGIFLQVIWAIGVGMVIMAALVHLPRLWVLAIGAFIVAGHNVLDPIQTGQLSTPMKVVWNLFMQPGPVPFGGFDLYPAVPWFGIMCLGYGLGNLFTDTGADRTRNLGVLAGASLAVFIVLRLVNHYGDPDPWSAPANPAFTPLAFIDVEKYPPSLDYVLLTLGVSILLFMALPRLPTIAKTPLLAFGRTSLFTYIVHIYVVHVAAILIGLTQGVPPQAFLRVLPDPSRVAEHHFGLPLWGVYLVWLAILALLYPLSRWYANYRSTHRTWWTSYI